MQVKHADGIVSITTGIIRSSHRQLLGLEAVNKDAAPPALTDSAAFKAAMVQVDPDGNAVAYLNVTGLYDTIENVVNALTQMAGPNRPQPDPVDQWKRVRQALGGDSIRQIAWSHGFDGRSTAARLFIDSPSPRTGMASMLDAKPLEDHSLKLIPKSAAIAAADCFDLSKMFDQIRQAVATIDPQAQAQFDQWFAQLNVRLELDIREQLLGPLGHEWAGYADRSVGGTGTMGLVIINRLRDAETLDIALQTLGLRIEAMAGQAMHGNKMRLAVRSTIEGGVDIHYLAAPFVAPAWAIHDGHLFVGFYPQVVAAAVDYYKSDRPSILDNKTFATVRRRLHEGRISSVCFIDVDQTADAGYQSTLAMLQLGLGMADMFGIDTPAMVMPPLHKLRPHLHPAASVGWVDDTGRHIKSVSPFPGASAMLLQNNSTFGQQAMMLGTLMPTLGTSRRTALRMKENARVRGICAAAIQYSQGNNGIMAPDLATMLEGQYFTAEYLIAPRSRKHVPPDLHQWTKEKRAQWVQANASYVYLGRNMRVDLDSEKIVVYQKFEESDGRTIAVCFGDNHTESLPIQEARRRIKAQTGIDPMPKPTLPESDRKRLEDLGYIVPPQPPAKPADP